MDQRIGLGTVEINGRVVSTVCFLLGALGSASVAVLGDLHRLAEINIVDAREKGGC